MAGVGVRVAVGTCLYESARPYMADWCSGILAAAGHAPGSVAVVAVNDGLADPHRALEVLAGRLPVSVVNAPEGAGIPAVRQAMVAACAAGDADAVAFCDADDIMADDALAVHAATLAEADVSVGDLVPFGATSDTGRAQFGDDLPVDISAETLRDWNVCGFSNTAVRRSTLQRVASLTFPPVTAVDWWMFATLAQAGARIRGVRRVVAMYRQHAANTLGAGPARALEAARARLRMVAQHHRALGGEGSAARAQAADALARSPGLAAFLTDPGPQGGPWFADTARWIDAARPKTNRIATA